MNRLKQNNMLMPLVIILLSLILRILTIGNNDLLVEEAYYWNYAAHLDIGYLDHPPMVAFLIKLSTLLLGTTEWGVRFPSILCWLLTAFFSFKLTQKIQPKAGLNAVMLLAILPFFFIHSLIITPDLPLMACWAAALYFLFKALILEESKAWYMVGLWLGLGLISKYTIVLLGLATFIYMVLRQEARPWFSRKEPYLAAGITLLCFSPVIYWNATHGWVSFLFQSTRRFQETSSFTLHEFVGLLILFLTPLGVLSCLNLLKKQKPSDKKNAFFFRVFAFVPLMFFAFFSIRHPIKFNWIGPSLLALIPWIAVHLQRFHQKLRDAWLITGIILLTCYVGLILCISLGKPEKLNRFLFNKYIAWQALTQDMNDIAQKTGDQACFVALDRYNIASELTFYQEKLLTHKKITQRFEVLGSDVFGGESLMYRYWSKNTSCMKKTLILVSHQVYDFENPTLKKETQVIIKPTLIYSKSQGAGNTLKPYYYEVVRLKTHRE